MIHFLFTSLLEPSGILSYAQFITTGDDDKECERGMTSEHRWQEMEEEIVCNRWKDLAGDQMCFFFGQVSSNRLQTEINA